MSDNLPEVHSYRHKEQIILRIKLANIAQAQAVAGKIKRAVDNQVRDILREIALVK
jgi:hypothetical protein